MKELATETLDNHHAAVLISLKDVEAPKHITKEALLKKVNSLLSNDGESIIADVKLNKIIEKLRTELKCIEVSDHGVSLKSVVKYK